MTPSHQNFIFSQFVFVLFCFSELPLALPPNERTHLVILGAIFLLLGVALTFIFYLRKGSISLIAVVSTGDEEGVRIGSIMAARKPDLTSAGWCKGIPLFNSNYIEAAWDHWVKMGCKG